MEKLTLEQIEGMIDHYEAALDFERACIKEGLTKITVFADALEKEYRHWLQMSIDRRKEAGLDLTP